jgi:hypothetical protein
MVLLGVGLAVPIGAAVAADAPVVPAPPANLGMTIAGTEKPVAPGAWIDQARVDLHFAVAVTTAPLTPQVEIQPSAAAFTGKPNFEGVPLSSSGTASVRVRGLRDGRLYHWAARVVDSQGNASGWVAFAGLAPNSTDLGIDLDAPTRAIISSSTNPDQNRWYNTTVSLLSWQAHDALSGIAGYTYQLQRAPHVIPPGSTTAQHAARISQLGNGVWFLALRAVDRAGNWSPTATFRLQIDRQPPHLVWLAPKRFSFNPYRGPATMSFKVDEDASARLSLYRVGSTRPVLTYTYSALQAGQVVSITWHGKTAQGKMAPKGYYFFSAQVIDRASNLTRLNVGGIDDQPILGVRTPAGPVVYPDGGKDIIVSLSQQTLYAYNGIHLDLRTYVTTGNPSLPTPAGHYTILEKLHPFEFISPWPPGSPYWYAPSWTQFAMLFRDGGYFLHDAPWRSAFGPGTNGPGQPGTNYGGTHGCVNIPPTAMTFLWNWSPVGTPVDVVP